MREIFRHVQAPAPRYMMRLDLLERLIDAVEHVQAFAEIGPGRGDVSAYVATRFASAHATLFEYSPAGYDHLVERFAGREKFKIQIDDFTKLDPLPIYDLVLAFEVLEHIEDDEAALARIHRMLKPKGRFLMSVPAYRSRWRAEDEYAGHVRRYEREELRDKLESAGFRIQAHWMYGFPVAELLFPVRELYYRAFLRENERDMRTATQSSGIERSLASRLNTRAMSLALAPFFALQWWVHTSNLGDGFLVSACRA